MEWDRITQRIDHVSISASLFRALINEVSDEKLEEIAGDLAHKTVKDLSMLEFGKMDIDTLLRMILLIYKYGGLAQASIPVSVEGKVDGQYTINLCQNLGPKGALILRSFFDHLVRQELGRQPTISVSNDVVTVTFPKLSKTRP